MPAAVRVRDEQPVDRHWMGPRHYRAALDSSVARLSREPEPGDAFA